MYGRKREICSEQSEAPTEFFLFFLLKIVLQGSSCCCYMAIGLVGVYDDVMLLVLGEIGA